MEVLCRGLEGALERFGGVPEELLFDKMRSVVVSDDRLVGGGLALNAEFLRFAGHWGFRPRACRPYRARTKGKVGRPVRYVRRHGTTGERPQYYAAEPTGRRRARSCGPRPAALRETWRPGASRSRAGRCSC